MATSIEETWFLAWLARHQGWNRGPGRKVYDSEGHGVYLPWIEAFDRDRVTEDEADRASRRLAAEEPRSPEYHLHRLPALVREARAARAATSSAAGSVATALREGATTDERDEAPLREAWKRLEASTRARHLDHVRTTCPHVPTRLRVERIARTIWGEEQGLVALVSGVSMIDHWRLGGCAVPAPDLGPAEVKPIAPPVLTAEQEAEATARAIERHRELSAQLQTIKAGRALAS